MEAMWKQREDGHLQKQNSSLIRTTNGTRSLGGSKTMHTCKGWGLELELRGWASPSAGQLSRSLGVVDTSG